MTATQRVEFKRRLGRLICHARMKAALGQDEATALAGLSRGALSRIENGYTDPQASTLFKLAGAFRCPVTTFFPEGEMR